QPWDGTDFSTRRRLNDREDKVSSLDRRVADIEHFLRGGRTGDSSGRSRIEIPSDIPRGFGPSTGGVGSASVGGGPERPPTIPELRSVPGMIGQAVEVFEEGYEAHLKLHEEASPAQKKRAKWKRDDKALDDLGKWLKSRGGLKEE